MCGIVGLLAGETPVTAPPLERALAALHHRGPDAAGLWIDSGGAVGLGSARLSIIDLEGGDQPLSNEDGRLTAVVNGELYDFERIRRRLQAAGHRFRTGSDSEIVLHLYEDEGVGCLEHLRGEFAFLLWDRDRRRLFAARDRFGIKPLFYSRRPEGLYLGSEVKALAAAGLDLAWDEEAYLQQLFVCPPPERTLFAGVNQLPPGHYLLADDSGVRVERYWDFDYPRSGEEPPARSEADSIEEVREALDEAVRLRLRADVPVGCFLSGGVDSSTVIGLASRQAAEPIRAFNVAFTVDDYDEREIARETAAATGSEFAPLELDNTDFADHLDDAVWHAETLGINPHGVARYLQSRAVRQAGYKVVLSGEGSDEIFAGYSHARQDLARLAGKSAAGNGMPKELAGVASRLGFVPSWLRRTAVNRSIFHALLAPALGARLGDWEPYTAFIEDFDEGQLAGREPLLKSLYLWSRSILPNYILFAERLEMAHSIEVRLPFLDHHLVERVSRLPVSMLVRGTTEKYVLREAARSVLTDRVYRRHKHPFTAPPATLSPKNRLFELMQDTLRGPQLAAMPFFDQKSVVALLDHFTTLEEGTRIGLDAILLMILCTAILQRRYGL